MGARHVDKLVRTDRVMYMIEDRAVAGVVILGQTPNFGESTANPKWQIRRISSDTSGIVTTEYANKAQYTGIWDDRTTYFGPPPVNPAPPPDGGLPAETVVDIVGQAMAGGFSTPAVEVGLFDKMSVTMDWTGVTATNGKAVLEASLDNLSWDILGGEEGSLLLDTTSGYQLWEVTKVSYKFIRLTLYPGNVVDGTCDIKFWSK